MLSKLWRKKDFFKVRLLSRRHPLIQKKPLWGKNAGIRTGSYFWQNPLREKGTLCRVIKVYWKGLFKVPWANQSTILWHVFSYFKTYLLNLFFMWEPLWQSKSKTKKVSDTPTHWSHHPNPFIVLCIWTVSKCGRFHASPLSSPFPPWLFEVTGPALPRITITSSDSILPSFLTSPLGWFFFSPIIPSCHS